MSQVRWEIVPNKVLCANHLDCLQTYEFNVEMTCGGCSGAVEKVLGKLGGEFFLYIYVLYSMYLDDSIESSANITVNHSKSLQKESQFSFNSPR